MTTLDSRRLEIWKLDHIREYEAIRERFRTREPAVEEGFSETKVPMNSTCCVPRDQYLLDQGFALVSNRNRPFSPLDQTSNQDPSTGHLD